MKTNTLLFAILFSVIAISGFSKNVTIDEAKQVAETFLTHQKKTIFL